MFSYQVSLPDFELRLNIIYCYAQGFKFFLKNRSVLFDNLAYFPPVTV